MLITNISHKTGLTSDRVYHWRIILKEYGPKIIYIKEEHNTVADAISLLDFSPKAHLINKTDKKNWMILTKRWCAVAADSHKKSSKKHTMDLTKYLQIAVTKKICILKQSDKLQKNRLKTKICSSKN